MTQGNSYILVLVECVVDWQPAKVVHREDVRFVVQQELQKLGSHMRFNNVDCIVQHCPILIVDSIQRSTGSHYRFGSTQLGLQIRYKNKK